MSSRPRRGDAFCSECFEPRVCGGGAPERMLTCSHCGVRTLHIVSGMNNPNDPYDYGVTTPRPQLAPPDPEAVLAKAGVRVVYVRHLGAAILLDHKPYVLIDAALDDKGMWRVVNEVLKITRDERQR
jgi:hypothetical protein